MGVFSKVFKGKDGRKNDTANKDLPQVPQQPTWKDAWTRTVIQPEEMHDLLRTCTLELKARGLDVPFLLLPFRPASDLSATRTFIRNYFGSDSFSSNPPKGSQLVQELRMTEPLVIAGVMKWCWSRLPGGVVTWEAYELFKIGENDSSYAPDAFATFLPISVGSGARSKIIFDFFEILSAIAAHGKVNGFSGRKLSRYAAWWAFEFSDSGNGFDGGYKTWSQAADATSHLFFAYLRSLSPSSAHGKSSILGLPRALQHLLETTEYPPKAQRTLQNRTSKVVMIVDTVSPTPFALLRRAKNFHYREEDAVLRHFSDFDDPVAALTNECKRVLKSISSANESTTAKHSTSLRDASWSRFEDMGFDTLTDDFERADEPEDSTLGPRPSQIGGLRSAAASKTTDLGRPTTPSWADFMSSGFQEQVPNGHPSHLLPPDKILPPIGGATHSSLSNRRDDESTLEPGELASISAFDLDDTFWWVWITSLAGEEPAERKAAFGRCALVETKFGNQWIVMEEIVKGAAPELNEGAYIAEKKSRFGFSSRGRKLTRSKSSAKGALAKPEHTLNHSKAAAPMSSKTSIAPDQHARIQAAAAALQERNRSQQDADPASPRRARHGDDMSVKTNSVLTLQPMIMNEAVPALQWASKYDKNTIRAKYLGDSFAGRGSNVSLLNNATAGNETTKSLEPGANGQSASNGNPVEPVKVENQISRRAVNVKPRDESANVSASNPTMLQVLQNGPPGSKPYQGAITKKPVANEPQIVPRSQPPVQSNEQFATSNGSATATSVAPTSQPTITQAEQRQPQVPQEQHTPQAVPPPVQRQESNDVAHASRQDSLQQSAQSAPRARDVFPPAHTGDDRPVSPETSRSKLQKKAGASTGLKGIFGRRKKDEPIQDFTARKPSGNSSAVAAARAALEAKAAAAQKQPEVGAKVTSKRFSTISRKLEPEPVAETARAVAVPAAAVEDRPPPPAKDSPQESPVDTPHDGERSQSIVEEEQRAEEEFRTFDQGPLDDVPAFIPADTPRAATPVRRDSLADTEHDISPVDRTPPQTVTTSSAEDAGDGSVSPNDRWAQIRKNAAERAAAARPSEEQSRRTERTDDDDADTTDGEETIESRVARIKARVAELTGNMDLPERRRAQQA